MGPIHGKCACQLPPASDFPVPSSAQSAIAEGYFNPVKVQPKKDDKKDDKADKKDDKDKQKDEKVKEEDQSSKEEVSEPKSNSSKNKKSKKDR